ncbi:MAG TPA: aldehyde dehydrogenase [Acidiferrobacteraceae bacterium]|nr:aldehyde dehydrogenase [Acidiferrobacteraceae bacterium]
MRLFPEVIPNWIAGVEVFSESGNTIDKCSPHSGEVISRITRSTSVDVLNAIKAAKASQTEWAEVPPVQRGYLLHQICNRMEEQQATIAKIVAKETGKSYQEAYGETGGAISLGRFFAGEGQRLYGRTTTSGQVDKYAMTVRQPCGVAGLIVAANTPIANVAWKVFPALICGNSVVLKVPEDAPAVGWVFAKILHEAGLPKGVCNVVQGLGIEAGAPIVESADVDIVSFTGSTEIGRWIAKTGSARLARISLELGGKNPLVVCDDADLEHAVKWVCLSAFSNAGQRCAAGSRIIVFDGIYDRFRQMLVKAVSRLRLGPADEDDLGPVINRRQLDSMLAAIETAKLQGANVLIGGRRLSEEEYASGYYMAPTVIDNIGRELEISRAELFGPIAQLYRVDGFEDALNLANDSPYGLTACIHTKNFDRASHFVQKVRAGVAVVNAGTYGSEPHMPFGGYGMSGNGSREPGTEALDVYSELKDIYLNVDRGRL